MIYNSLFILNSFTMTTTKQPLLDEAALRVQTAQCIERLYGQMLQQKVILCNSGLHIVMEVLKRT